MFKQYQMYDRNGKDLKVGDFVRTGGRHNGLIDKHRIAIIGELIPGSAVIIFGMKNKSSTGYTPLALSSGLRVLRKLNEKRVTDRRKDILREMQSKFYQMKVDVNSI